MTRTLKQWETYLSDTMPRVRLLGELGLNYADMLEIANLIKGENAKYPNVHRTTTYLVSNCPRTFIAFLAAFAAQNTERDFWDALARLLGVSSGDLNNSIWRKHFIGILKKHNKPSFENVGGASNKYVTSIRIHGGIPSYSLNDFFANMLMPALEKPEYRELKGLELREALLKRSVIQYFTDSTVRNFFENSGEIGVEFLESSRNVAREYRSKRQILSEHGLPDYVVEKLVNFLENHEDDVHGLRRPRIRFDVEGDGLLLELPQEPLSSANVLGTQVRWCAYQNKKLLKELRARITRSGRDVHTEQLDPVPLGYIVEPFQVTFSVPGQSGEFSQMREWTFDLRSPVAPNLFVFRREDRSFLRWSQALPAQDLLLVHSKDISLEFEGEAHLIYSADIYAEGWHNWIAEEYSLEGAFSFSIVKSGETLLTIPIQKQLEFPRLVGTLFSPNLDSKPLYVHNPPALRIPLRPGATVENELKRWHLELTSAWEAEPPCHTGFKLSEKPESITADESAIEFDLAAILGKEPKGTYTLRVRGPLETDVEFPFRVWPSLYIKNLPEFILPIEDQKIALQFRIPVRASLEPQAGATGVNVEGQFGQYNVELSEVISSLDLNLVWRLDTSAVHVPFSLPISHIKWRFVLGEEGKQEWSNRLIRKPVEAFLQSGQIAALLVRMPGIEKYARRMIVRLTDPEKPEEILQEFPVQSSVLGSDHVRFLLNAKDTVRSHASTSVFEFKLLIPDAAGIYQSVPLLTFTRDLDVTNIRIEETDESLFLLWKETAPLRNRRVFIRSMWKVWADAWNIKIPDEARGKFDLLAAGYGLPPSWYEIHFYVAPSWQDDITSLPDHSVYIVKTISPEDQIEWLDNTLQKHPENAFVNHFERACLYATIGELSKRDQEIFNCYNGLGKAKLKDLLLFHDWVDKYDPSTKRAVRMKMYNPEYLQPLFSNYKSGDEFRQKYLRHVVEAQIKPESALLLIENENDPPIVFHALRELIKRRDNRLFGVIALMLEEGRLLDADAIELLRLDEEYCLSELDSGEPTSINLRLLSGLLEKKDELLGSLSNAKILSLAKASKDHEGIKKYLGILISRGDLQGMKFVMELFQQGLLLGHEVTELLGKNPSFSMRTLRDAPQTHAYTIQQSELIRRYPIETGHITAGMFVKTPAGWGQIDAIEDASTMKIAVVSKEEKQVRYHVTLYPGTEAQIKAILDLGEEKLYLPDLEKFFQCGICKFISLDQDHIIREHTRKEHGGVGASVTPNLTRLHTHGEIQFSQNHPK